MNKEAKILITGGTGLIGSYLLRKLLKEGYQNISCIKRSTSNNGIIADIENDIDWCIGDIRDSVSIHDYFEGIDLVVHCAGMISFWPKEFRQMYDINVVGTENIVNLCLEHNVKQLIHLSSIEALGKNEDNSVIDEETEYKEEMQHTKYANTKYLGELEAWRGSAEGLNTVIYNPALVMGATYWNHGPMKVVSDVFHGLDYYPQGTMPVIDVRDLVDAIVSNLNNEKLFGQRVIVGSHHVKYKELLDTIASNLKVDKPSKVLTGTTARLAIFIERLKSIFTNAKPLINKEIYFFLPFF